MKNFANFLRKCSLKSFAFTTAEIAVTVGVAGIVSVFVLGAANKEITSQMMNTERVLINNEIAVAAADMQAEGKLAGYSSQEAFTKALGEYYGIKAIPEGETSKWFASEYTDENGKKFSANDFSNKVTTPSGASFAYTYDTSCNPKHQFSQNSAEYQKVGNNYSYNIKNEALSCLKGFYDINGAKGPNEFGKDVIALSEYTKDCKDEKGNLTNFIPNAFGNCPNDTDKNKEDTLFPAANVCSLTELNCKANGSLKTLDRNACECVCRLSCPKGQTLNKKTCTCSCDTDKIYNTMCIVGGDKTKLNSYADCNASKQACTCMPKNPNAPQICKNNGGEWNTATCRCVCKESTVKSIENKYNNLATADLNNFCVPKCRFTSKNDGFKAQVKQNAAKNSVTDAKVIDITNSDTVEQMCFSCATDNASNVQYIKNTAPGKGGYCAVGCSDTVKNSKEYDTTYFEFLGYNANDTANSCRWKCKDGDNVGIKNYVKTLNNNAPSPIVKNSDGSQNFTNYALAQYHYFEAAAIGKGQSQYSGTYGDGIDQTVNIGGKNYTAQWVYNCEDRGCGAVYRAFKDNNSAFAGFLRFIQPSTAPAYSFGWPSGTNANTYKIHYTANTNTCTISATGFSFGTVPTTQIPYHSAGVDKRKWEMVTFSFTPITNSSLTVANPNSSIKAPESFKSQGGNTNYSDNTWKALTIGVSIGFATQYDPLALNISSTPMSDPQVVTPGVVKFPIVYDSKTRKYDEINVHWPKEDLYQFVVDETFKNGSKNIGHMFSDQISWDGNQYSTGFDQLQAQYDKDNDKIISRDELNKLYTWKKSNNTFKPLSDFVLDLNLYKKVVTDESGNPIQDENIIYDIQGKYRKLVALNNKPTCANGKTCVSYIGYDRSKLDSNFKAYITSLENKKYKAELWQDIQDNNVYYYYLREVNVAAKDYPADSEYKKITKTEIADTSIKELPKTVSKIENVSANTVPEKLYNIVKDIKDATVTVYKDSEKENTYYVSKETTTEETSETPAETKTELTQYEVDKYTSSNVQASFARYFTNGTKWYEVVTAKITDIIFKYNR